MSYGPTGRAGGSGAASSYRQTRVMSSTPVELIVMLHERLLADLKGAAIAIRSDNIQAKATRAQSATDVIFELMSSLDRQRGGEVSDRLAALYNYMLSRISDASRTLDPAPLDEVAGHVESLLTAWAEIATGGVEAGAGPPTADELVP